MPGWGEYGTIIALSEDPPKDVYENKILYLYKKAVNPWEYDQIHIGDALTNGKEKIFEILDKEKGPAVGELLSQFGESLNWDTQPYQFVKIKVNVRLKKQDGQNVFGEEYVVSPGRVFPVSLNNLTLNDYTVIKVDAP